MPIRRPPALPPLAPSLLGGGNAARNEISCHRGEVLSNQVPTRAHGLGVPARTVLAATSDVRQHIAAATGQPQPAHRTRVGGDQRHSVGAVSGQQRRARATRVAMPHHEIRDRRAVGGGREVLRDDNVVGIEHRRRRLDHTDRLSCGPLQQAWRRVETVGVQQDFVTEFVGRADCGVGVVRHPRYRLGIPAAGCDDLHAAGHIGACDHDQPVTGPRVLPQRGVRIRLEEHPQFGGAGKELIVVRD